MKSIWVFCLTRYISGTVPVRILERYSKYVHDVAHGMMAPQEAKHCAEEGE